MTVVVFEYLFCLEHYFGECNYLQGLLARGELLPRSRGGTRGGIIGVILLVNVMQTLPAPSPPSKVAILVIGIKDANVLKPMKIHFSDFCLFFEK